MEAIRMFLFFSTYKNFRVYQMDIMSTLLNGELEEEVCIEQLDGFGMLDDLDMVFTLKKALFGLKQALRAWYERREIHLL